MPDNAIHEEAAAWCLRLIEGEIGFEEELAFEAWLDADPLNRHSFRQVAMLWHASGAVADAPELIGVRADALDALRAANHHRWSRGLVGRWGAAIAMAACFLLLMASGIYMLHDRPRVYETQVGERRLVKLEDGSTISLDAATRVKVVYSDERRAMYLVAGRAKFDVAKDPRRPFTVSAEDRMVVATGTAFSVELVQRQMRVVLYEGNVAVLEDGPSNKPPKHLELVARRLAADQAFRPGSVMIASLDKPVAEIETADLAHSLSWEGGQLTFSDEPLSIAAERINRYSDMKLAVRGGAENLLVSGAFHAGDTEGFIDGISVLYPLQVTRSGNIATITNK